MNYQRGISGESAVRSGRAYGLSESVNTFRQTTYVPDAFMFFGS